jgi:predicted DNA binding CopG/RHH family protein
MVPEAPMKKLKPLPKKIPRFSSYEEEANFWDTHDTSRLIRYGKQAKVEFVKPMKHLISIRIDLPLLEGLQTMAARKHMPYQTLIHSILAKKLHEWHKKSA